MKADLSFDSQDVFSINKGSRPNVKKVLIVITDGESYDSEELPNAAKAADNKNIVRFAIGVSFIISLSIYNGQYYSIVWKPSAKCLIR